MPARRREAPRIQVLARADAILSALAEPGLEAGASLARIVAAVGLNKATTCNLLASLVALGYVEHQREARVYRLGLRAIELGRAAQRRLDVSAICRPFLLRLSNATRETVNLALPYGFDAMIVDSLEGTYGVRVTSYAGTRAPYHSTACGKALLAEMPEAVRREVYAARPLMPQTPRTLATVEALEADLGAIRARGYALDIEENEPGANCLGMAFRDGAGEAAGAISIAGPVDRMTQATIAALVGTLRAEITAIEARLRDPFATPKAA